MFTLLLLTCGAGNPDADAIAALALAKAARERVVVVKPAPTAYEAVLARVLAGETVIVDSLPGFTDGPYRCFLENGKAVFKRQVEQGAGGDDAPTPQAEVDRVLALLPKPVVGFVDYGCGADARWCIAAAQRWGGRVTGVEIDPARAKAARERVAAAGLAYAITIIEGDAITTDVQADVGVVYLYADVLEKLKPKLEKLTAFASYMHQPPGIPVTKNGDSWLYVRGQTVTSGVPAVAAAVWGNQQYTRPVCNSPNCAMCNSIRGQLSASPQASTGHWEKRCTNGHCWYEWVTN